MTRYYIIYCGRIILDSKWFASYSSAEDHLIYHPPNVVSACEIVKTCYPENLYGAPEKTANPHYYPGVTDGEIEND